MRHFLFLLLAISMTTQGFAEPNKKTHYNAAHAPRWGAVHMLSFRQMAVLSRADISSYVRNIKRFLVEQENKKKAFNVASEGYFRFLNSIGIFQDLAWGDDTFSAQGTCLDQAQLSSGQAQLIKNSGDQCVIGGYMVCMSLIGGRLRCSPNESNYRKFSAQNCSNPSDSACAYPLFMTASGGTLCVSGSGPITPKCLNSPNGASDSAIAELIKTNPLKYQANYDALKNSIEKYCGQGAAKSYSFDVTDCNELEKRLSGIASPKDAARDTNHGIACQTVVKPHDKNVVATLSYNSDGTFNMSSTSAESEHWKTGVCNSYYKFVTDASKLASTNQPYSSCLYRILDDSDPSQRKIETLAFDSTPSCQIKDTTSQDGYMTDNELLGSTCEVDLSYSQKLLTDGKTARSGAVSEDLGINVIGSAAAPLFERLFDRDMVEENDGGEYTHFVSGDSSSGYTEAFYNKNTNGYPPCWGRIQKTLISTQTGAAASGTSNSQSGSTR